MSIAPRDRRPGGLPPGMPTESFAARVAREESEAVTVTEEWLDSHRPTSVPVTGPVVPSDEDEPREAMARELYRQWRVTGDDPADLPDWEHLEPDVLDEDEPDPKRWYRARATELLSLPEFLADRERYADQRAAEELRALRPLAYELGNGMVFGTVCDLLDEADARADALTREAPENARPE